MFRTIKSPDINSTDETTIGNALSQLQKTHGGRAGLFILGFFLLVYGTFAVCSDATASYSLQIFVNVVIIIKI